MAGERRWRASREAGLERIPAIVRETADDVLLRDALLENLHRAQLNALEEAAAYQQLLDDFGCTQEELATRIGRSRPQVSNTLRLLRLPPRCSAGWPPACSRPATRAPCSRSTTPTPWTRSPPASWPRGSRCARSRRSSRSARPTGASACASRARARPSAPGLTEIADRLSDRLETRVRVEAGKAKGKVTIEFATLDDLRRIVDVIDG